jgi:hypothetical protein
MIAIFDEECVVYTLTPHSLSHFYPLCTLAADRVAWWWRDGSSFTVAVELSIFKNSSEG